MARLRQVIGGISAELDSDHDAMADLISEEPPALEAIVRGARVQLIEDLRERLRAAPWSVTQGDTEPLSSRSITDAVVGFKRA